MKCEFREIVLPKHWQLILLFCTSLAAYVVYGMDEASSLTATGLVVTVLLIRCLLYAAYIIRLDQHAIEFGYLLTGREHIPFGNIDSVELVSWERKTDAVTEFLQDIAPPVYLGDGRGRSKPVFRLKLKQEMRTHYRLRRSRPVDEFMFFSRRPSEIEALFADAGLQVSERRLDDA